MGWFALFWAIYVMFVIFAMTRIITAVFLKDTLQAAADDAEKQIRRKLHTVFAAADTSGDGRITMDEFENFLKEARVRSYLEKLGLETDSPEELFKLLDDDLDGAITNDEFLERAAKMKGTARSQDMKLMMRELKDLNASVKDMQSDSG